MGAERIRGGLTWQADKKKEAAQKQQQQAPAISEPVDLQVGQTPLLLLLLLLRHAEGQALSESMAMWSLPPSCCCWWQFGKISVPEAPGGKKKGGGGKNLVSLLKKVRRGGRGRRAAGGREADRILLGLCGVVCVGGGEGAPPEGAEGGRPEGQEDEDQGGCLWGKES